MFTRSAQYVILSLAQLAAHPPGARVHTAELARSAGVPRTFLAKLVPPLVRAGLVQTSRGRNGGLELARKPEEISIANLIRTVDGERFFEQCLFKVESCTGDAACPLYPLWDPIRSRLTALLETTTLDEIAQALARSTQQGVQSVAEERAPRLRSIERRNNG